MHPIPSRPVGHYFAPDRKRSIYTSASVSLSVRLLEYSILRNHISKLPYVVFALVPVSYTHLTLPTKRIV